MRTLFCITISALALLLTSGCCACRKGKNNLPLEGQQWQLVRMMGRDYTFEKGQFTFSFGEDEIFAGRGACNQFSGGYTTSPTGALTFDSLGTTRMMCPDQALESEFAALLERITHYEVDGSLLLLLSNGEMQAVLSAVAE